jgi:hypothetical protein
MSSSQRPPALESFDLFIGPERHTLSLPRKPSKEDARPKALDALRSIICNVRSLEKVIKACKVTKHGTKDVPTFKLSLPDRYGIFAFSSSLASTRVARLLLQTDRTLSQQAREVADYAIKTGSVMDSFFEFKSASGASIDNVPLSAINNTPVITVTQPGCQIYRFYSMGEELLLSDDISLERVIELYSEAFPGRNGIDIWPQEEGEPDRFAPISVICPSREFYVRYAGIPSFEFFCSVENHPFRIMMALKAPTVKDALSTPAFKRFLTISQGERVAMFSDNKLMAPEIDLSRRAGPIPQIRIVPHPFAAELSPGLRQYIGDRVSVKELKFDPIEGLDVRDMCERMKGHLGLDSVTLIAKLGDHNLPPDAFLLDAKNPERLPLVFDLPGALPIPPGKSAADDEEEPEPATPEELEPVKRGSGREAADECQEEEEEEEEEEEAAAIVKQASKPIGRMESRSSPRAKSRRAQEPKAKSAKPPPEPEPEEDSDETPAAEWLTSSRLGKGKPAKPPPEPDEDLDEGAVAQLSRPFRQGKGKLAKPAPKPITPVREPEEDSNETPVEQWSRPLRQTKGQPAKRAPEPEEDSGDDIPVDSGRRFQQSKAKSVRPPPEPEEDAEEDSPADFGPSFHQSKAKPVRRILEPEDDSEESAVSALSRPFQGPRAASGRVPSRKPLGPKPLETSKSRPISQNRANPVAPSRGVVSSANEIVVSILRSDGSKESVRFPNDATIGTAKDILVVGGVLPDAVHLLLSGKSLGDNLLLRKLPIATNHLRMVVVGDQVTLNTCPSIRSQLEKASKRASQFTPSND